MKTLISILILIFIVFSSSIALEPVRCAVCYTGGGAVTVDVQLHDYGTSTNVYPGTGNQNIGSLTANSSGVISFVIGSGDAAWTAITAASITNNYMVNVYINGSIAAYLRLDELVVEQGIYGSSIEASVISLPNGEILVGDGDGEAASRTPVGDVTMNNTGSFTVDGLQGRDVVNRSPADGQVLAWDHGDSRWEPTTLGGVESFTYVFQTYIDISGTDNLYYIGLNNLKTTNITLKSVQIMPAYNGKLKRVIIRPNTSRNYTIGFHKNQNTTPVESVDHPSRADDNTNFDFSSSTFAAGDILNISIDPASTAGDLLIIVIIEYTP
jgi:hypothetical protein